MPQLIIEQPGVPPMTVPLAGNPITLGRSDENNVVLVAEEVSRFHARITPHGRDAVLTDLKSMNGTYVNRLRVEERVLKHLDEIWFGSKCRIIFRDDTLYGSPRQLVPGESRLEHSIDEIRAEMDAVGRNMTLIGRRTPRPADAARPAAVTPEVTQEDIVRMSRAYRRLEALYKANQAITSNFDIPERLSAVLDAVMAVLLADRGFVLLRDERTGAIQVRVARKMGRELHAGSPSMGIAGRAAIDGEPVLMTDRDSDAQFGGRESIIRGCIMSAMAAPLRTEDRVLGSIYLDTANPELHFTEEDLELFATLAAQAAMAIDNARLHVRVLDAEKRRNNLARFLPGALVEKIMNENQALELGGQKTCVTTLFCDIRGSSLIAEQLAPHELVLLLNEHFTAMTEILFAYEGTLDKYIGDEIMAIFGAPIQMGDEEFRAVRAAVDMQRRNAELNLRRQSDNRPLLHFGIGIDSGDVIAGYIGSPKRMDFTVVGDRVNTAKRLCDLAGPGKVVVGQQTWEAVKDRVNAVPMGALSVKGRQRAVQAYEIVSILE